jgi:hypothetical protein
MLNEIRKFVIASTDTENHGDSKLIAFITGEGANGWYRFVNDAALSVDKPKVFKARFTNGYWVQTAAGTDTSTAPAWDTANAYQLGDVVSFAGIEWICIKEVTVTSTAFAAQLYDDHWHTAGKSNRLLMRATLNGGGYVRNPVIIEGLLQNVTDFGGGAPIGTLNDQVLIDNTALRGVSLESLATAGLKVTFNGERVDTFISANSATRCYLDRPVMSGNVIEVSDIGLTNSVTITTETASVAALPDVTVDAGAAPVLDKTASGNITRLTNAAPTLSINATDMEAGMTFNVVSVNEATIDPGAHTVGIGSGSLKIPAGGAVTIIVTDNTSGLEIDIIGSIA